MIIQTVWRGRWGPRLWPAQWGGPWVAAWPGSARPSWPCSPPRSWSGTRSCPARGSGQWSQPNKKKMCYNAEVNVVVSCTLYTQLTSMCPMSLNLTSFTSGLMSVKSPMSTSMTVAMSTPSINTSRMMSGIVNSNPSPLTLIKGACIASTSKSFEPHLSFCPRLEGHVCQHDRGVNGEDRAARVLRVGKDRVRGAIKGLQTLHPSIKDLKSFENWNNVSLYCQLVKCK